MPSMSPEEIHAFLTEAPRTAKLGCVRADGRPHVAPVWFALDGEELVFTTGRDTVKGRAIRRDPRVCLCVDDDRPPFGYAVVQGAARLVEDMEALREWAGHLGARYLGEDAREEMAKRNGVPGELLIRVTPTHMVGERGVAS